MLRRCRLKLLLVPTFNRPSFVNTVGEYINSSRGYCLQLLSQHRWEPLSSRPTVHPRLQVPSTSPETHHLLSSASSHNHPGIDVISTVPVEKSAPSLFLISTLLILMEILLKCYIRCFAIRFAEFQHLSHRERITRSESDLAHTPYNDLTAGVRFAELETELTGTIWVPDSERYSLQSRW